MSADDRAGDRGGDNAVSEAVNRAAKRAEKAADKRRFEELWEGVETPRVLSSLSVMIALALFLWTAPMMVLVLPIIGLGVVFFVVLLARWVKPSAFRTKRTELPDGFVLESGWLWTVMSAWLMSMGVMMTRMRDIDVDPPIFIPVVGALLIVLGLCGAGGAIFRIRGRRVWFAYGWHTRRVVDLSGYSHIGYRSTGKGGMALAIEGPKKKDEAPDWTRMYSRFFGVFSRRGTIALSDVIFMGVDLRQLEREIRESAGLTAEQSKAAD